MMVQTWWRSIPEVDLSTSKNQTNNRGDPEKEKTKNKVQGVKPFEEQKQRAGTRAPAGGGQSVGLSVLGGQSQRAVHRVGQRRSLN